MLLGVAGVLQAVPPAWKAGPLHLLDPGKPFPAGDTVWGPLEPPPHILIVHAYEAPLLFLTRGESTFAFSFYRSGRGYFVRTPEKVWGPFGMVYGLNVSPEGRAWGFVFSDPDTPLFQKMRIRIRDEVYGPYDDVWGPVFSRDGRHAAFRYRLDGREYVWVDGQVRGPFVPLGKGRVTPSGGAKLRVGDSLLDIRDTYLALALDNDVFSLMAEPPWSDVLLDEALAIRFQPGGDAWTFVARHGGTAAESGERFCHRDFRVHTPDTVWGPFRVGVPAWAGPVVVFLEEDCPRHCCRPMVGPLGMRLHRNGVFLREVWGMISVPPPESLPSALRSRSVVRTRVGVVLDDRLLPFRDLRAGPEGKVQVVMHSGETRMLNPEDLPPGRLFADFATDSAHRASRILALVRGEDVNVPDLGGWTALHWAAWDGDTATARRLLAMGARWDQPVAEVLAPPVDPFPGYRATLKTYQETRDTAGLAAWLEAEEPERYWPLPDRWRKFRGWSALNLAAYRGHKAFLAFLIRTALQTDRALQFRAFDGKSLLHFAAFSGNRDLVEALLAGGLSPNERDRYGLTPLHLAAFGNEPTGVATLLEAGARPEVRSRTGRMPCDLARGREVRRLLRCAKP